jgi:hypothetical protein
MKNIPLYLRFNDLAKSAQLRANTLERYIYHDVITPDALVQHGRTQAPIFLAQKLDEHLKAIREYRESIGKANGGGR